MRGPKTLDNIAQFIFDIAAAILRMAIRARVFLGGGHPSRGDSIYQGGAKIGKRGFSRRRSRCEKFLSTFFEILNFLAHFSKFLGNLLIKMQSTVILWVLLVDTSRKCRKNSHFWEKNTFTNFQKF